MQRTLVIKVEVAEGVKMDELRSFIIEALETWGGQRDPNEDPLFDSLKVNRLIVL